MKRLAAAALALLLAGCAASTPPQKIPQSFSGPVEVEEEEQGRLEKLTAPELIAEGKSYLRKGNLQLAQVHFLVALKKAPPSAELFFLLGETFFRSGDVKRAFGAYTAVIQKDPEHVPALIALGILERSGGNPAAAAAYLETALKLAPTHVEVLSELGITLDQLQRFDEAEEHHLKVVELRPRFSNGFNNLGFHYFLRDIYSPSIKAFEKALQLNPENRSAKNNLAVALILSGEEGKGLAMFQNALGEAQAWNNLGYILMQQGKYDQAEKAFRRALELNPRFYVQAQKNLQTLQQTAKDPSP